MEVFKCFKLFGLYIYVSSIRMKRRRSVEEKARNRRKTLHRYKSQLYSEQDGCCGECGRRLHPDGLEIHHIVSVSENPGLMLKKHNMILLCHDCHVNVHRKQIL